MKTFAVTLASLALAAAAPNGSPKSCPAVKELATFDNLATLPAAAELSEVGTYKGIDYSAFDVLQLGAAGIVITGVIPASGDQVAVNGVTNEVTSGGAPAFIVKKPYKYFDLNSLFFGCAINSVSSATGVPEQCTVAFTAYKQGSSKAFQTINEQFNPSGTTNSKMAKVTFPKTWTDLQRVDLAVVQATGTSTLTALLVDSVSYELYKC